MKASALILSLFLSWEFSFGQADLNGRVKDVQGNYLPAVTIILLAADSAYVDGVATDSLGGFVFQGVVPGSYVISASMVGYGKFLSGNLVVSDRDVSIAEIVLEEETTQLGEVVVNEDKLQFEQKIDRFVINLQGSITSSGNSILEVLQKSPGIVVNRQNSRISMSGKSGVQVMINNKVVQLPPDAVLAMLEGMNAANVEKIELITAPPSEFDAEGNGGVIHIVTKSSDDLGTNASFGLFIGARWAEALGANFNVHHRSKKAAYFVDYSISRNHNLHISELYRDYNGNAFPQTVTNYSHRENLTTQQNVSIGFEWQVSNKSTLNVLLTGYGRNWDLTAHTEDKNQVSPDSTVTTGMDVHESNIWKSGTASLGLQTKTGSRSEMRFSADYLFYHNDNPSTYDNKVSVSDHQGYTTSKIDLSKSTPIHIGVVRADFQQQTSPSFVWEAGVKLLGSALDNNVTARRLEGDMWTTDPAFTSHSTLDEYIYSAYVYTRWAVAAGMEVNTGLRYEYTHTSIGSLTEKNLVERNYGYWFPNVALKKKLATETDIELSYTRRITRPTYSDIAPYVFFWGPRTFSAGNTSLYPAVANAVTAGYHVKKLTISVQYSYIRNEIATMQAEVDDDYNLILRSQNLKHLNTWGATVSRSFSLASWWEIQGSLTTQYQTGKTSHLPNNINLHLYGLNLNLVSSFKLPREFAVEISGIYQSASLSGASKFLPMGSLNAGIQKSFGRQGVLRLSMDDILATTAWRIETTSAENNLSSYFGYDWHNRFIRLTYTRNLGNSKLRALKANPGLEDERRRVGN